MTSIKLSTYMVHSCNCFFPFTCKLGINVNDKSKQLPQKYPMCITFYYLTITITSICNHGFILYWSYTTSYLKCRDNIEILKLERKLFDFSKSLLCKSVKASTKLN